MISTTLVNYIFFLKKKAQWNISSENFENRCDCHPLNKHNSKVYKIKFIYPLQKFNKTRINFIISDSADKTLFNLYIKQYKVYILVHKITSNLLRSI